MEIRKGTIIKVLKKDPLFKTVKFVISARDRENDTMLPIKFIHSDGNRLTGCDRHRVHYADDIGIPAGLYEVMRNMPTFISLEETNSKAEYPDIESIIKLEPKRLNSDLLVGDDIRADYMIIAKTLPEGSGVDYNFFKAVHHIYPHMSYSSDPKGLIVFRAENLTAIIMPFTV